MNNITRKISLLIITKSLFHTTTPSWDVLQLKQTQHMDGSLKSFLNSAAREEIDTNSLCETLNAKLEIGAKFLHIEYRCKHKTQTDSRICDVPSCAD